MQVTETLSSGLKREFKVVVGAAELSKELDSKLHEMAGRANIKGFRPGKVPVPHLKRMYGKALMAEVVQKTIDDQSKQVVAERNLKPALPAGSEASRGREGSERHHGRRSRLRLFACL
jgi:trigger factor